MKKGSEHTRAIGEDDPRLEAYTLLLQFKEAPPTSKLRDTIAERTKRSRQSIDAFIGNAQRFNKAYRT